MFLNLKQQIKKIRPSIIAIGFKPSPSQITIIGSGFAVSDNGKILSSAHLYNKLQSGQTENLMGMVMTKQDKKGLEHYKWFPLNLINKDDKNDIAILQIKGYKNVLLRKLEFGDSEKVEVGEEMYFMGFPYAGQLINDGFGITLIANRGIISNIKRDGLNDAHPKNWFVIDAISNPGNSGCPLISTETNKVVGIMTLSFRIKSKTNNQLDIREPMHICAAKPINLAKSLLS